MCSRTAVLLVESDLWGCCGLVVAVIVVVESRSFGGRGQGWYSRLLDRFARLVNEDRRCDRVLACLLHLTLVLRSDRAPGPSLEFPRLCCRDWVRHCQPVAGQVCLVKGTHPYRMHFCQGFVPVLTLFYLKHFSPDQSRLDHLRQNRLALLATEVALVRLSASVFDPRRLLEPACLLMLALVQREWQSGCPLKFLLSTSSPSIDGDCPDGGSPTRADRFDNGVGGSRAPNFRFPHLDRNGCCLLICSGSTKRGRYGCHGSGLYHCSSMMLKGGHGRSAGLNALVFRYFACNI